MIAKIIRVLKNPIIIIRYLGNKGCLKFLSDEFYLKILYRGYIGKKLDLRCPKSFNEKLQWLKLYDRNPIYTKLADKYEVREYIKSKIGEAYLIPLLGVYDNFDEINFNELPNQFVLKTTHDSGGVVICRDKNKFNIKEARKKLNKSISRNYYNSGREWQYKNIKPRIICEKYMVNDSNEEIKDYKLFCFNGKPKMLYIAIGTGRDRRGDFYDMNFNLLNLKCYNENIGINQKRPESLDEMIDICKKLSKDIPHIRVDLYEVNGNVYFGELTLHHTSGFAEFDPEEYDEIFGSWIDLNKISNNEEVNL